MMLSVATRSFLPEIQWAFISFLNSQGIFENLNLLTKTFFMSTPFDASIWRPGYETNNQLPFSTIAFCCFKLLSAML